MLKIFRMMTVFAGLLATDTVSAQNPAPVLLSGHTYSPADTVIGTIHSPAGEAEFSLKGPASKQFVIKGNVLSILSRYAATGKKFYDIDIEARTPAAKSSAKFRIVKNQFIKNRVIAHRGAWKNTGAAENSILALTHAISLGCEGSEFDVHMSADSVLVVNHDATIQGLTIAAANGKQLKALKLSSGENMPGLEDYLKEGMKQNSTKLILEIKPTTNPERALKLAQKVVKLVTDMKAQAWIDYISFDYNICREVQRLDPYARIAYLNGDKSPAALSADKLWGYDYHFSVLKKNESWIADAQEKGLTTNVWTVNDAESLQWFLDKKIDFITTNEPELLLKMVSK